MTETTPENGGAPTLSRVDRLLFRAETFLNLIAAASIFALMFLGVAQVLGRKLFDLPVYGYIDMVEQSVAIFAFLGVAYCQKLGGHVRMDLFLRWLPGRWLWLAEAIGILLAMVVITLLIESSYGHFLRAYINGDSTIDVELPIWPSKLLVPFAFCVLWLRLAIQLVGYGRLVFRPQAMPVAVPLIPKVEDQAREEIEDALGHEATRGGQ
jgi:TRAP-type C4-dicarboxylate transport system permease small subunit